MGHEALLPQETGDHDGWGHHRSARAKELPLSLSLLCSMGVI